MSERTFRGAPVIIVGPGRSGTTLLGAAMGEHPNFYMIGETKFLFPRLWNTLYEFPNFFTFRRFSKLAQQTRPEWRELPWYTFAMEVAGPEIGKLTDLSNAIAATEKERIAQELGAAFARICSSRQACAAAIGETQGISDSVSR